MTKNKKVFNLFLKHDVNFDLLESVFCYCCPVLFLLSKTLLYSLLFSKYYCLVQTLKNATKPFWFPTCQALGQIICQEKA